MSNPHAAFVHRDFKLFTLSRFLALIGYQILIVAVSQYVYEVTKDPLHLGLIGLTVFLPKFLFTLPSGMLADRFDRWLIILLGRIVHSIAILGLLLFFYLRFDTLHFLYFSLFIMGIATALGGPASQAIVPQLVPAEDFNNAVMWNSSVMHGSFIIGPALGGFLYAILQNPFWIMAIVSLMHILGLFQITLMKLRTGRMENSEMNFKTLAAGVRYVFKTKIILGTISLDLFAVLLGGAVGLMPVFANDILHVGARGLGLLRAAPSVGAALMAMFLAYHPGIKKAGQAMLWSVAVFGLATIAFGLSKNFYLSLLCLFILGAADMISVVIRHILVQMKTPPEMRGRVSAVNLIFIGASNELGEFESGLTAKWFGTIPAVLVGGLGTLAVTGLWSLLFSEIRNYKSLDEKNEF